MRKLGLGLGLSRGRRGSSTPATPAAITINSIGPQAGSGDVPVDYTIDQNDSTVEVLIALAATAAPAASVFGADSGGGADAGGYTDCGTVNLTTSGSPINLTIPTGLDDSYKIHLLPTGGGDSDVASSAAVTIDTTAPILSLPGGSANGATGATSLGVTTDEGNGTLYWGIYPTASTPDNDAVIAGTGATVSGSQAVSGTGAQAVSDQTGLTESTAYKPHYVHVDAVSNKSALSTGDEFTTTSASVTLTLTQIGGVRDGTAVTGATSFSESVDFGAAKAGKRAIMVVQYGLAAGGTGVSVTFGGAGATVVTERNQAIQANTGIYSFDVSAGGSFAVAMARVGGDWRGYQIKFYTAENSDGSVPTITGYSTGQAGVALMDLSQSVIDGDEIVGVLALEDYPTAGSISLVGLTQDGGIQYSNAGSKEGQFYEATATATGTRTMTVDAAGTGTKAEAFSLAVVTP